MSESGWVKNHRQIKDWGWYKKPLTAHLFQHLIREANHKPGQCFGIDLERGQLIVGRKKLASDTGLTEQEVRTALNHLKSTNDITTKSTSKFTIVTVCNYGKYQADIKVDQPAHQPGDQPTINQVATTNKNGRMKEVKEEQQQPFNVTPSVIESVVDGLF